MKVNYEFQRNILLELARMKGHGTIDALMLDSNFLDACNRIYETRKPENTPAQVAQKILDSYYSGSEAWVIRKVSR